MNHVKKAARTGLMGLGALLIVLGVTALVVPRFIDVTRIRDRTTTQLSALAHGQVRSDALHVSLLPLPSAVLDQVSLSIPGALDLKAASVSVYPKLLPLLRGKLRLAEVRVQSPAITFQRPAYAPATRDLAAGLEAMVTSALAGISPVAISPAGGAAVVVNDGTAEIPVGSDGVAQLRHIDGRIELPPERLKIDVHCTSNLWDRLSVKASLDPLAIAGTGDVEVVRLRPDIIAAWSGGGLHSSWAAELSVDQPLQGPATFRAAPHGGGSYTANDLCLDCHKSQAKQWATSHHFQAMARATPDTVLGNFSDAKFERDGVTSRFFRRDDKSFVHTDGPNGTLADFPIAFTFGVDPLQQYLIELPGGRLQGLTIAWDTARKRWFHLYPDEPTPPGDVLHWTGRYQNWNMMCASCHSTNVRKGYDAGADRYDTTWSEINVSCQSCHGPGASHALWARARENKQPPPPGIEGNGLVVDSRSAGEVDLCAACHARRSELTAAPVPGAPLYDNFLPSLLTEDLYYPDGQQLGEVYEYGSFRQSKMYRKGIRCTDCHDAHTAKLKAPGNALCVRCHRSGFASATARDYDSPGHHFHKAGSPGSLCVNCHMPARNYMIVHARRDHAIRVPRPDLTVKIGTPNACSGCHANHPAKWAADAVTRWYAVNRQREPHYGQIIAAGRVGRPDAEEPLRKLVADSNQPAIVRATALNMLRRYGPSSLPVSIAATRDADPAVRVAAVGSLERVLPDQRVAPVAPLLTDPMRAVRIEAARVLSSVPPQHLDAAQRSAYDAALAEFVAAQNVSLDMPGAHLNLGAVDENQGRTAEAEQEYLAALRLDPDFTPARLNLAQLFNRQSRNADAEKVLKDGIARIPDQGELQYSLGLLLAEEERLGDAAAALGRAAQLMPVRARVRYNYGLALQHLGRRPEAEAAFTKAHEIDPGDPDFVYALVILYTQSRQWLRARAWAEELATLSPDDPDVRTLLKRLRQAGARDRSR